MQSTISTKFWWLRHDWVTYKVPVGEGKVVLPEDYLKLGFEFDPLELRFRFIHDKRDQRKIADFSEWAGGALFVNERAFEVFEDMFMRHGRVFPAICSDKPYFIVLIDSVHASVDMQRSRLERLHDDGRPLEEDISQIKRIVLRQNFSTTDDIFRTNNGCERNRKLDMELIVSDRFKVRYEQANLTGLFFKDATSID